MNPADISYGAAFAGGLLSFLSPCVLPLVPIYLGYLTGAGAGNRDVTIEQSRVFTFAHGLAFVLGFSLVFVAWGAIGGLLGDMLSEHLVISIANRIWH